MALSAFRAWLRRGDSTRIQLALLVAAALGAVAMSSLVVKADPRSMEPVSLAAVEVMPAALREPGGAFELAQPHHIIAVPLHDEVDQMPASQQGAAGDSVPAALASPVPSAPAPAAAVVESQHVQAALLTQPKTLRPAGPTFDGRPLRKVRTMKMVVTAYSPDERSCGLSADGITASGYSVWTNGMKMVAADTRLLPFGTIISVPGYHGGKPVPVLDRGGAIKGHRLDVLYATHEQALVWGKQTLTVDIWEYAD